MGELAVSVALADAHAARASLRSAGWLDTTRRAAREGSEEPRLLIPVAASRAQLVAAGYAVRACELQRAQKTATPAERLAEALAALGARHGARRPPERPAASVF